MLKRGAPDDEVVRTSRPADQHLDVGAALASARGEFEPARAHVVTLQQVAGNRATAGLLRTRSRGPRPTLQRVPEFEGELTAKSQTKAFKTSLWRQEPHLRDGILPANISVGQTPVGKTKHHFIPLNKLREFVFAMNKVEANRAELGRLFTATTGTMMTNSPTFAGEPKQGDTTQADVTRDLGAATWGNSMDAVISSFSWMPGNLFIGPVNTQRVDDPDEDFEDNAQEPAGAAWNAIVAAKDAIDAFIAANTLPNAQAAVNRLLVLAAETAFHPYDESHWEILPLGVDDVTFAGCPATVTPAQLLMDVAFAPGKRYLFRLRASGAVGGAKRTAYIAKVQADIDQKITELNKPPATITHDDDDGYDLGNPFDE